MRDLFWAQAPRRKILGTSRERINPKSCISWLMPKINLASDPNRELARRDSNREHACRLCKKLYIGKTGRRLGDRFQEDLHSIEKDNRNKSKPGARQFNLPNHSKQHMAVCSLSLHQGSMESSKTLEHS